MINFRRVTKLSDPKVEDKGQDKVKPATQAKDKTISVSLFRWMST
jgi:hypothetical protein